VAEALSPLFLATAVQAVIKAGAMQLAGIDHLDIEKKGARTRIAHLFRHYIDALYEGGFDGVLSVEHEDPVWGGTPELIEAGLEIARNNLRGLVVQ